MKLKIRKWAFRLLATGLFCLGCLLAIILNPSFLYANKTIKGNFNIYHQAPLDQAFISQLEIATKLAKSSKYFDPQLKLDICLNDGSLYPLLMEKIRGQAFAWGFYDKLVLLGQADSQHNKAGLNGYDWNLSQLLAHEIMHCLQFNTMGFWNSNPVARYPDWKWEGYPEYVARRNPDQNDLSENIARKLEQENSAPNEWAIHFSDSTITPKNYYQAWILMQFCLDTKQMTYEALLNDTTSEQTLTAQMMDWFSHQKANNKH
jgi:hypothetical protein